MTQFPERIGLCPNRFGEAKYVVAGKFFKDGDEKEPVCEHCGEKLIMYVRERTSLMAVDG